MSKKKRTMSEERFKEYNKICTHLMYAFDELNYGADSVQQSLKDLRKSYQKLRELVTELRIFANNNE